MQPRIEFRSVTKEFAPGVPIFRNISFTANAGEWLSLVGRSGVGKSTLLNLIVGADVPTVGSTHIDGRMSFVPQRDLLLPWRTAIENALLPFELAGPVSQASIDEAFTLFQTFGLDGAEHLFPSELSGGMAQRVSIVRALLHGGSILLLDEPFSAIDFSSRLKLGKLLRELALARGMIVVFVTHNIEEALALGDRVLVLSGRPASVREEIQIAIDEAHRDPVEIRKWSGFGESFETIWRSMEGGS